MKINKVSIFIMTIKAAIGMIVLIIVAIFLAILRTDFLYFVLLWILMCVYIIVYNFTIADIEIAGDVLFLTKMNSKKEINLSGLKIYNIVISMHPVFYIETSAGNINVNYTKKNYQIILELLRRNKFSGLELFESTVKRYIINVNDR